MSCEMKLCCFYKQSRKMNFHLVLQFCAQNFICFAFINKAKQLIATLLEDLQFYSEGLQKYAENTSV